MLKRIIPMLLILCLLISIIPECHAIDGWCGDQVSWRYNSSSGLLTINGEGPMDDFNGINRPPWYLKGIITEVKQIRINNGVTHIGNYAFASLSKVTKVSISNSVRTIGMYAFEKSISLTNVTIPNSVVTIGRNAFEDCTALTSATISNSVIEMGTNVFKNCSSLSYVSLPNSISSIPGYCFYGCKSLASISLPYSVSKINAYAFQNCTALTTVNFSSGLRGIAAQAFAGCTRLTYVELPDSLISLGESAFEDCTRLRSVYIPGNLYTIKHKTFSNCVSLRSVEIGYGVRNIEEFAFMDCITLPSITIPKSVVHIDQAFVECQKLQSITILNPECGIFDNACSLGGAGKTIYGYAGSTADVYAAMYDYNFQPLSFPAPVISLEDQAALEAATAYISDWVKNQEDINIPMDNSVNGPSLTFLDHEINLFNIGKMEFKIPGHEDWSITYSVDPEKQTVKFILGYTEEATADIGKGENSKDKFSSEYRQVKEFFKCLSGKDISGGNSAGYNKYKKLRKKLKENVLSQNSYFGVSSTIRVFGYAELGYEEGSLKWKEACIACLAEASVSFTYQPQVVYVSLSIKGSADMNILVDRTNGHHDMDGSVELALNPVCGVGWKGTPIEVYIEGGANAILGFEVNTQDPTPAKAYITGEVYLKGKAALLEGSLTKEYDKYYIFPKGLNKRSIEGEINDLYTHTDTVFTPIPRDYLNAKSSMKEADFTNTELHLGNVYPYAGQTLLTTEDQTQIIVYVGDNGTKGDMDRTTIFYRIFDGNTWSEERPIYESGTYMDSPRIFENNGRIYAAWIQANRTFDGEKQPEEILKSCDLYLSEFVDGSFNTPLCITGADNHKYERNFTLGTDAEGNLTFYWCENEDSIYGTTGINKLYSRTMINGEWGDPLLVLETENTISAVNTLSIDNRYDLSVILSESTVFEVDGETESSYLHYIYILEEDGTLRKLLPQAITAAQFYKDQIYLVMENEIFIYDIPTNTLTPTGLTDVSEYAIVGNGHSTAIIASIYDGLYNELYVSYLNDGTWSEWKKLTNYRAYIRTYSAIMSDDGAIKLSLTLVPVEQDENGNVSYGSSADLVISGNTDFIDLYPSYIVVDQDNTDINSHASFLFGVENMGNTECQGFTVELTDSKGQSYRQSYSDVLLPGTQTEVEVLWNIPVSSMGNDINARIIANGEEHYLENNRTTIQLCLADLIAENPIITPKSCSGAEFSATIRNQGYGPATNIVVKLYSDPSYENLVSTIEIPELHAAERQTISMNLPTSLLTTANSYVLNALYIVVETETEELLLANNEEKVTFATIENPHTAGEAVRENVFAPSCTASGCYDLAVYCENCGIVLSRETFITEPAGHSEVIDVAVAPTCTESGLTQGIHCYTCYLVLTPQETVPATGHNLVYTWIDESLHSVSCSNCTLSSQETHTYTDDLCLCGTKAPLLDGSLRLSHSLNLASDISLNFVVPKSMLEGYDMDTVYVESIMDIYEGNEKLGTRAIRTLPVESGPFYYFTLAGLTAIEMNDRISSVLYGVKGDQPYHSPIDDYSIADYAYSQLNKSNTSQSLKTLCADLLRYGAKAQLYKEYRTDALADVNMTESHQTWLSDMENIAFGNNNKDLNDLSTASVTWIGKTLYLDSKVSIKFVFNVANFKGDISNLNLHVSYRDIYGETVNILVAEVEEYNTDRDLYTFTVDALLASELREVVSVQIYEGEIPVSSTLQYSADTYGNNKSGTLLDLCKALFAYSDSAKRYFDNE